MPNVNNRKQNRRCILYQPGLLLTIIYDISNSSIMSALLLIAFKTVLNVTYFNVDFSKDRSHTTLLAKCCRENDIVPVLKRDNCSVDCTYLFNMSRFNQLFQ